MKKGYLFVLLLFISSGLFAQSIGKNVELLVGKTLVVKPLEDLKLDKGYDGFYKKVIPGYGNSEENTAFSINFINKSNYDSLVNKSFKCISVKQWPEESENEYYAIELQNPEIGTVFFKYDTQIESTFSKTFKIVGGLTAPAGYYCNDIKDDYDKFTHQKSLFSPEENTVFFEKQIKNGKTIYLLGLQLQNTSVYTGKGFAIIFKDKTRMSRPLVKEEDINIHGTGANYIHSILYQLTETDILKLKTAVITDIRIYQSNESVEDGDKYRDYLNCLLTRK